MTLMYQNGPAALMSALFDDLQFGQIINRMVHFDESQCHLTPGERAKALIINFFSRRRPLYRTKESYQYMDIENFFGQDICLDDLSDNSMARALDKLAKKGAHEIFSTICLETIFHE